VLLHNQSLQTLKRAVQGTNINYTRIKTEAKSDEVLTK